MNFEILKTIPKNVRVIAVSKLQPLEKMKALAESTGHKDFGENYTQEALPKLSALENYHLTWHLIGHLQTNKIKQAVGHFQFIHSVDSEKLLLAIQKQAQSQNTVQKILLQINVAGEDSKGGFSENELNSGFQAWKALSHVNIVGLMTMPPLVENGEQNRPHFLRLKSLADHLQLKELSMGTSHDYKTAIECGATMIRLGTLVFGER